MAYASVLLFNALDLIRFEPIGPAATMAAGEHELLHQLADVQESISSCGHQGCYNDALYFLDEIRDLFRRGQLSMRSQALAENLFLSIMYRVAGELDSEATPPPELGQLPEKIADVSFDFVKEMHGDSIADVLRYVEYDPRRLQERFRKTAEHAVRARRITPAERAQEMDQFAASLRGYTYFEK